MIHLICTNCEKVLHVDDAFAGGVCRCRHCGTIQTVPADAARVEGVIAAGGERPEPSEAPRSLYNGHDAPSGLDDLANAVAGSGMMSSGLRRKAARGNRPDPSHRPRRAEAKAKATRGKGPDRRLSTALGVLAIACVLGVGLLVAMLARGGGAAEDGAAAQGPAASFAGLPLGRRVAFVIDRGTQTQPFLRELNAVTLASAASLAGDARFQVVYWSTSDGMGRDTPSLPGLSPRSAGPAGVEAFRRGMAQVNAGGSTDALPALELALAGEPDTVVLATAKAWQLEAGFAEEVIALLTKGGREPPAVHAITVGDEGDGPGRPMARVAEATGGRYLALTPARLRDAASEADAK